MNCSVTVITHLHMYSCSYTMLFEIGGCPTLENPANGWVMYSTVSIGGVATYFCSDGYSLSDQALSTCDMTGMWSGNQPECKRMFIYHHAYTIIYMHGY